MPETTTAGIDIGAVTTDVVILRGDEIIGQSVLPTLADGGSAAQSAYCVALEAAGMSEAEVSCVVATGYGRAGIGFAHKAVTEITCHALGARHLFPEARCVIDIGGQDSKVIRLADDGRVEDFVMNDKCAAGTGRFLEVMARALGADLDSLGELSALSTREVRISSTCTVFAESEVVALVAKGVPREDIIRGLHDSISERICAMASRLRAEPPFVITGGVAKNSGVVSALADRLNTTILVPTEPQIVGALGAATVARSNLNVNLRH